jgi:hypothetical protein
MPHTSLSDLTARAFRVPAVSDTAQRPAADTAGNSKNKHFINPDEPAQGGNTGGNNGGNQQGGGDGGGELEG